MKSSPRLSSRGPAALLHTATLATLTLASLASAQERPERLALPHGGSFRVPQTQKALAAGLVTSDMLSGGQSAASLVAALVGAGVPVSNITFNGAPVAAGTFSGGTGIVGFAQGVMLSSGDISSVVGPQNMSPATSTDNGRPGDPDLDLLVGGLTQDSCVLEFDFSCPNTNVVSFQYVFSSEEFDEWVNTQYNDVFAFFLNGQNIALIPNTTTAVAINNVNCGNPWVPGGGPNCPLYTTNDCDSMGMGYPCNALATEMDGITSVFSATGTVLPGTNHIKLVVADRGDSVYDTNVFIRGQSFACAAPGPAFDPPSPCGQILSATTGLPFGFEVHALATSGLPGEAVVVDVTGDAVPLAGGVIMPPVPAGPAPEVSVSFEWTPAVGDVGVYHLFFTATDQINQVTTCEVIIEVSAGVQTWTDLGHAKVGIKGLPQLTGHGVLFDGNDVSVELSDAKGSSTAILVFGLAQINAPFKGGVLVPQPLVTVPMPTNSGGNAQLPFIFPAGVPAGISLYFQFWIQDPSASNSYSASNGLRGVTS